MKFDLALSLTACSLTLLFCSAAESEPFPGTKGDWNGFEQYSWDAKIVVVPHQVAPGKPWILRARFWGHEPQFDIAMLTLGYHVAYCDVSHLYGNNEAIQRWNAFHAWLTERHGFARKVVLEGFSRGGLAVYNWAAANPGKVAAIYGDAPVMDFKSWPGAGSKEIHRSYGFRSKAEAQAYPGNPVDNLQPLAEVGIPIIHVVGDADETVPVAENTTLAEKRYHALGGVFEVIHKPRVGHHPHSLENPTPIVEFIQKYALSATSPVSIVFDTDMGSDCDDVGALALLHQYANAAKAEILGCVYSSGKVPYGAGVIEAINRYYGRPDIPIGAYHGHEVGDPVDKMRAEELAQDQDAYGNTLVHNHDAPELTHFLRQLLLTQPDHSVTYVTVGHTKGLHDLLNSQADDLSPLRGDELVSQKVRRWVALGALGANNAEGHHTKDWNFAFNGTAPATAYLVEHWPVPAHFVSAGADVKTGKSLESTPPGNIVRAAYTTWLSHVQQKTLADQRPSWDLAAVYFAVEGLGDFLQEEEPGWLEFDVEQGARWIRGESERKHHYICQQPGITQRFSDYLNHMIALPPSPAIAPLEELIEAR